MKLLRTALAGLTAVAAIGAGLAALPGPATARDDASRHGAGPDAARDDAADDGQACSTRVSLTGHSDVLDKAEFDGRQLNGLSALATDPTGRVSVLSDRSVAYVLDEDRKPIRAVRLRDEAGQDLDSEGLVIRPDGTHLVASELEPSIRAYSPDGQRLSRLPVPDLLRVAPDGGGMQNRTFEGLSLQPTGQRLFAAMEAWLADDHQDLRRIQSWTTQRGAPYRLAEQYAYRADARHGISEITALGQGRLLVLERTVDGDTWGARLYLADTRRASDVSDRAELSGQDDGVTLASKKLLADLGDCPGMDPAQPDSLLDNIEGMTVTGVAGDGRSRLLLVSDDNASADQVSRLYSLTVDLSP